jgi:serine protease Do
MMNRVKLGRTAPPPGASTARRRLRLLAGGAFLAVASLASRGQAQTAGPARRAPDALPALPGASPSPAASPVPGASPLPGVAPVQAFDPRKLYEHLRRGVVAVERNGVPAAVGTVLGGDGRVLTSLSGLGGADTADIRYADGTAVHARVGESDTALDLALLVPQSTRWTEGLIASEVDPAGAQLRAMLPSVGPGGPGGRFGPALAGVKGQAEAHARDGQSLLNVLDIDLKGPAIAGAPLLDMTGGVVAVLVRACKGWSEARQAGSPSSAGSPVACVPVVVGAPVSTLRSFLSRAPAAPAAPAPWLGIRGEPAAAGSGRGVRITAVAPSSPAEKAGLKVSSDVIVAVDGQPIDTPERLAEAIGRHAPGDSVKLLVFAGDRFREVSVALRPAP